MFGVAGAVRYEYGDVEDSSRGKDGLVAYLSIGSAQGEVIDDGPKGIIVYPSRVRKKGLI